jgi:hypothetical protein
MSFEAFVQIYNDGELTGIPRQQIRDSFGSFLSEGGAYDWHLYYDEANNCDVILKTHAGDKNLVTSFTVVRPCGDPRFWDAMVSILRLGNVVLFFPANCPPLVADNKVAQHLPPDMIETLGEPRCVSSAREILDLVREG